MNQKLKYRARELRNNMTNEERILWSKLRGKQIKDAQFYRQRPIGFYIVDFYCPKYKIVIELDGSQHFTDDAKEYDANRDEFLKMAGLKVLRYKNLDVRNNLTKVLEDIFNQMNL